MKTAFALPLLLASLSVLAGCISPRDWQELHALTRPKLLYLDARVEVVEHPKLSINPHADSPTVLTVCGKSFSYVRGPAPYYYSFEHGRYLLFSLFRVGAFADKTTLVVADTQTGRTQTLDLSKHPWGSGLFSRSEFNSTARATIPGRVLLTCRSAEARDELEVVLNPLQLVQWRTLMDNKIVAQGVGNH